MLVLAGQPLAPAEPGHQHDQGNQQRQPQRRPDDDEEETEWGDRVRITPTDRDVRVGGQGHQGHTKGDDWGQDPQGPTDEGTLSGAHRCRVSVRLRGRLLPGREFDV